MINNRYYRIKTTHKNKIYAHFADSINKAKDIIKWYKKLGHELNIIEEITQDAYMKMLTIGGNVNK